VSALEILRLEHAWRNRLRAAALQVALLAFASVIAIELAPLMVLDGPVSLLGFMLRPDTEYAPGYSDWRFLKVREGMSTTEVTSLLGTPLRIYESDHREQVWMYSRSPHDTHYRCRSVIVRDAVVVEIHSEFYFD
jgi:hypothetical protein